MAFEEYQICAGYGNKTAQFEMGQCYQYGKGVTQELSKAVECYEKVKDIFPVVESTINKFREKVEEKELKLALAYQNG